MTCRCCGQPCEWPLWSDQDNVAWCRCLYCGSDTSEHPYEPQMYDGRYLHTHHGLGDDYAALYEAMRSNLEWFPHHAKLGGRDFLDVGCCEGTALRGMAGFGWRVSGFDVLPEAKQAAPAVADVVIANIFGAELFPQQFDAVLCREVFEHVPNWQAFLSELAFATRSGGLLQLQTPRPVASFNSICYQRGHLHLMAPAQLRHELRARGFDIIESRYWDKGQAHLCRKR